MVSTSAVHLAPAAAAARPGAASRTALVRPALAPLQSLRRSRSATASGGRLVVSAAAASAPSLAAALPNLVVGASVLGVVQPALFSSVSPAYVAPVVASAVLLSSLSLDGKGVTGIALATAGAVAAAVAAPLVAAAVLGVPTSVDAAALSKCAAKVALLPLLAGAALTTVLPHFMAAFAPTASAAAAVLTAVACGSVVAQHAQAISSILSAPGNAWWRLVAAGAAALTCMAALRYAAGKGAGLPEAEARFKAMSASIYAGAAGAVLARAHFAAQPLVAVACVIAAALAASVSSGALRDAYRQAAAQSDFKSWEVPADTFIRGFWERNGIDPATVPLNAANSKPAEPANVAEARSWIAAWRAKRGGK